jgi:hypothetical protein
VTSGRAGRAKPERPWRLLLGLVVLIALVGGLAFGLAGGARPAWSFLAGFGLATIIATAGAVLVDVAGTIAPQLGMVVALANYVMTVVVFILVLRTVGDSTVDVPAFATGLASSVVPYLAWQFRLARPRP